MTQEEKAKRYDEAIERLRNAFYDNNGRLCEEYRKAVIRVIEPIFPELKESEDERIRRQTLKVLNYYKDEEKSEGRMPTEIDECIAWLEKQGEQKPVDKVEPKFKVGDTITDPTDSTFTFHINAIKDGKYMESDKDWVLIKEADSDYELVEQKPAWSEEDEMMLEGTIDKISDLGTGEMCKEWLNSLRHQNRWKPSDEQMNVLKEVIDFAADNCNMRWHDYIYHVLLSLQEQLKKLKQE